MGPRPDDRGNHSNTRRFSLAYIASMGPRPDDRGNTSVVAVDMIASVASMGPRPDDRGNIEKRVPAANGAVLQWGRDQMIAEILSIARLERKYPAASMGPRPDDRGNPRRIPV